MSAPTALQAGLDAGAKGLDSLERYASNRERNQSNERLGKMEKKEKKRKTLAELLDAAMGREYDVGKNRREGQREISAHQMKALSDMAANIRSALGR